MNIREYIGIDFSFGWFGLGFYSRQGLGMGYHLPRTAYTLSYHVPYSNRGWGSMTWGHFFWVDHNVIDRERPRGQLEEAGTQVDLSHYDFSADASYDAEDLRSWAFAFCNVSICGAVSEASDTIVATFNSAEALQTLVGNSPTGQTISRLADGKFTISWTYNPTDQPATPTGFKVLEVCDGWGHLPWGYFPWENNTYLTVVHTQPYIAGRIKYPPYTTASYGHLNQGKFLVRAYKTVSAVDYYEYNERFVSAIADDAAPAVLSTVTITEYGL